MRRATGEDLDVIDQLLDQVRTFAGLTEKKRGVFYRGSSAFLHFHEDGGDMYADLKIDGVFDRFRVATKAEQRNLVTKIRSAL